MISGLLRRIATVLGAAAVGVAATVTAAAPAAADVTPAVTSYVWASSPTATSYTVPTWTSGGHTYYSYAKNPGGGPITVTRSGAGSYLVRFGGLGSLVTGGGGVVHAQAYGAAVRFCTVGSWYPSGTDLLVNVYCFGASGARQDAYFVANFVEASGSTLAADGVSYLWSNNPTSPMYTPSAWYRYDASGGSPWVARDAPGSYAVELPASAAQTQTTFYQVTAYTSAAVKCKVDSYVADGIARVRCRNASGAFVDSRFTITWTVHNLLQQIAPTALATVDDTYPSGGPAPEITWTNDSSVSGDYAVTRTGTGRYEMFFPQIIDYSGHAVAYALGYQEAHCHVQYWHPVGTTDMKVGVTCVNSAGSPVNTPFMVGFTW
ncbi:hypothetical protein [Solwaraspora sp. WMMD792]|uniref:hypothetical protein n=1 Tax=Solwaraspora sp. WMMD792 TaxID=3016099 RepID=UPI0024165176|nr:hypothetical protein [Solwaraspora sp. WMMD792]MDG4771826.1 hypothetical protein [Solwaraspora sp. WMMD792]